MSPECCPPDLAQNFACLKFPRNCRTEKDACKTSFSTQGLTMCRNKLSFSITVQHDSECGSIVESLLTNLNWISDVSFFSKQRMKKPSLQMLNYSLLFTVLFLIYKVSCDSKDFDNIIYASLDFNKHPDEGGVQVKAVTVPKGAIDWDDLDDGGEKVWQEIDKYRPNWDEEKFKDVEPVNVPNWDDLDNGGEKVWQEIDKYRTNWDEEKFKDVEPVNVPNWDEENFKEVEHVNVPSGDDLNKETVVPTFVDTLFFIIACRVALGLMIFFIIYGSMWCCCRQRLNNRINTVFIRIKDPSSEPSDKKTMLPV